MTEPDPALLTARSLFGDRDAREQLAQQRADETADDRAFVSRLFGPGRTAPKTDADAAAALFGRKSTTDSEETV